MPPVDVQTTNMLTKRLQDLIRISVGTEHIDDIIADFEQSFKTSAADPKADSGGKGTETGDAGAPAKTEV